MDMTVLGRAAMLSVLGAMATGCLLKEESHTWYVDHTGAVTWMVTEKDVRSDAQAVVDRQAEESAYWQAVKSEMHPMARGLRLLGADGLRTRVVRGESPFTVVTDGRFTGLDELGRRILAHAGLSGSSMVSKPDGAWEWTMIARDPHASDNPGDRVDEGLAALLAGLDTLQVVLASGRFESAIGFDLSQDRRIASFRDDGVNSDEMTMRVGLRWR
jgi:hypothetical protein